MLYSTMVKQKTWTKPSHIDNTRQAYATDCCQNHWKGLCCVGVTDSTGLCAKQAPSLSRTVVMHSSLPHVY